MTNLLEAAKRTAAGVIAARDAVNELQALVTPESVTAIGETDQELRSVLVDVRAQIERGDLKEAALASDRIIGHFSKKETEAKQLADAEKRAGETREQAIARLGLPSDATDAEIAKAGSSLIDHIETDGERDASLRAEYPIQPGETDSEYDLRIARGGV